MGSVSCCDSVRRIYINLDNKRVSPLLIIVFVSPIKAPERRTMMYCDAEMAGYIITLPQLISCHSRGSFVHVPCRMPHVRLKLQGRYASCVYTQCGWEIGLSLAIVEQEQAIWPGLSMPWQPKASNRATDLRSVSQGRRVKDNLQSTEHDLGLGQGDTLPNVIIAIS